MNEEVAEGETFDSHDFNRNCFDLAYTWQTWQILDNVILKIHNGEGRFQRGQWTHEISWKIAQLISKFACDLKRS